MSLAKTEERLIAATLLRFLTARKHLEHGLFALSLPFYTFTVPSLGDSTAKRSRTKIHPH